MLRTGSLVSSVIALLICVCMGFEIYGPHTDYRLVSAEAALIGICLAVNLVCALLRLIQESHK